MTYPQVTQLNGQDGTKLIGNTGKPKNIKINKFTYNWKNKSSNGKKW